MRPETHSFAYTAISPSGEKVRASIAAPDRGAALRSLSGSNLVVLRIKETSGSTPLKLSLRRRSASEAERALILKQLSVLVGAGVDLLEAFETVRGGLPDGLTKDGMGKATARLRQGEKIATALAEGLPDYPRYVTALIAAGEVSGQLPRVLREASDQLAAEARTKRELKSALLYPAFLVCAGLLVTSFLFYVVVPRFAEMLGPQRDQIGGISNLVLTVGEAFRSLGVFAFVAMALPILILHAILSQPDWRQRLISGLAAIPGTRSVVLARQRATWTRIMSFAIGAGISFLEAIRLAVGSATDPALRASLSDAMRDARSGKPVAEALSTPGLLTPMDISLLRVGQRTGTLSQMFATIAEVHEEKLREGLKRLTVLIEQLAIAAVAGAIGLIVISLVTAMTSVYQAVE